MICCRLILDTNVAIAILKAYSSAIALLATEQLEFENCAISQITRMELLSYPNLEEKRSRRFKTCWQIY
ncbi:hypothetical protein AB3M80_25690 [Arthrospira platensis BEA 1257B]